MKTYRLDKPVQFWLANSMFVPLLAGLALASPGLWLIGIFGFFDLFITGGRFVGGGLLAIGQFLLLCYVVGGVAVVIYVTLMRAWQRWRNGVDILAVLACSAAMTASVVMSVLLVRGFLRGETHSIAIISDPTLMLWASVAAIAGCLMVWVLCLRVKIVTRVSPVPA